MARGPAARLVFAVACAAAEPVLAESAEVLLYVANEPAPSAQAAADARQIASWLMASELDDDRLLGAGVLLDLRVFPAVADQDVAAIALRAPARAGVVVATNRLAQRGMVLIGGGGRPLEPRSIELAPARDDREATSPLSSAANVRAVFEAATTAFDPGHHTFVVVVRSHGDERYALTPRLGLPTAGLTRTSLLERVHGGAGAFVERTGITTSTLLAMLAQQRRTSGMEVELLVLASCNSTIAEPVPEVPLALVAAGGGSLAYDAIDFARVLENATGGSSTALRDAFVATLTPTPLEVADPELTRRRRWQARWARARELSPYLAPLAAWCAVVAGLWLRARAITARQRRRDPPAA